MKKPLVFFYVQHLLGIGHLRRAAAIARAIEEAGMAVAFVSGGEPVAGLEIGGAKLIQLPPARSGDSGFGRIVDEHGAVVSESWWDRRRKALLDAFHQLTPDLVLIELFPFGRRPFRAELLPLLEAARQRQPRVLVACSVRDILVDKNDSRRLTETVDVIERYFEQVLVHGDPGLIEFGTTFAAAGQIAAKLRYTGYVVTPMPALSPSTIGQGEVLVSAGGGAVGATLLKTALNARGLTSLAQSPWRFVTGNNLPDQVFAELRMSAPEGVIIERFRADFQACLRNCRLSISQAGYNTVMEMLAAEARAVVVPFAEGGESEQPLRARLLAERGLLTVVDPDQLDPPALASAIDHALRKPAPARGGIDMAGAGKTARAIAEMLGPDVATGGPV